MIEETPITIHNPMERILQRLNFLNGAIQLLTHQLDLFQKASKKSFEEHGHDSSIAAAGFALAVPDLTTPVDRHYPWIVHGGAFIRRGEEYFRASQEFMRNW